MKKLTKSMEEEAVKLADEINGLYQLLKDEINRKTPDDISVEADFRSQWLARSAEIVSRAKFLLLRKKGELASKQDRTIQWSIAKMLIESEAAEYEELFMQAERLNATLTHQLDLCISYLSYEKVLKSKEFYHIEPTRSTEERFQRSLPPHG
jgi:hypothetical protein